MCRDVVPFTDLNSLPSLVAGDRAFQEAFGRSPFLDACVAWNAGRGDPVEATPVGTDVPTLAIIGRFDPFGTAPDAEHGMAGFAHGYLVVAPVNGHGVTGTEQWSLTRAWFAFERHGWMIPHGGRIVLASGATLSTTGSLWTTDCSLRDRRAV
jgi:pimeloyl-ACP methyl ester carboxylesterase